MGRFFFVSVLVFLCGLSKHIFGYNPGTSWRNVRAFAALKEDGTVEAWGGSGHGGSGVPSGLSGVKAIYSTGSAFAALKEDGTVEAWGIQTWRQWCAIGAERRRPSILLIVPLLP